MLNEFRALFMKHTVVTRNHLTPELALRLITSASPLWSSPAENSPFVDPYWAFYWPGGQAVARYILDNAEAVLHRNVLDIGCGCGAGAIAAALKEAKLVVANDIDIYAVEATRMNADLNKIVNIQTSTNNYIGTKCEQFDTILIGDMFYDEEFGQYLFNWLSEMTRHRKTILIGDPGRHGLTDARRRQMALLATYQLTNETRRENHGFSQTTVWRLKE
ncbi:electron transfer flavoprotein beta subunit lysine methyltransferase-like isoform X2 [Leptidea sinapis]|nr:electron transfer flavoprotein beta subunit lysine methyltransferase-like isoform X2 [Leptidea sinapis]